MSYILEALKRSEQERELGRVPGLVTAQDPEPARKSHWSWLVVTILVINGLLLAGLLMQKRRVPDALPRAVTGPESGILPPPDREVPGPATAMPPPVAAQAQAGLEPVTPPLTAPSTVPDTTPRVEAGRPAPAERTPEPKQGGSVVFAERPLDEFAGGETIPETKLADEPSGDEDEEQIPRWQDLPSRMRSTMPPLELDVHVYAAEPSERFVLVNLRKYHETDTLAEGPYLERITADGVVLNHQGQRFRINKP